MSLHISDEFLSRFIAGDLDESSAVDIATHLDECPSCATRAAALEPLCLAFAAMDDPVVPDGFVDQVLAEADRPRFPFLELGVGLGLLVVAVALIWLVDGPVGPLVESVSFAKATTSVIYSLITTLSLGEQIALVLLATLGAVGTLGLIRSRTRRPNLGEDRRMA